MTDLLNARRRQLNLHPNEAIQIECGSGISQASEKLEANSSSYSICVDVGIVVHKPTNVAVSKLRAGKPWSLPKPMSFVHYSLISNSSKRSVNLQHNVELQQIWRSLLNNKFAWMAVDGRQ
jgi:hypothetical protein